MVESGQIKVLHIAAHLGGGVGKALSSITTYEKNNNSDYDHCIALLDEPEKMQFINICRDGGVKVFLKSDKHDINSAICDSDIVIIHWWHHPVMAEFLANFPKVNTRVILWSHVNGCNYPNLPYEFVISTHNTFFTSPFSYENSCWSDDQKEAVRCHAEVVYGRGQIDYYDNIDRVYDKEKFIIGYVGTLNKSKLHPEFVSYCKEVVKQVPTAHFILVGDSHHSQEILDEARYFGIKERFSFTGYTKSVSEELAKFDVFAYPLNPSHFGTTENVLLEAMAFGLPVVALNHNTEKYIIKDHKEIGLLADCKSTYADCIKYLYDHPLERVRIGKNAENYIRNHFTFDNNVVIMRAELAKVMKMSKRVFDFTKIFGRSPFEWFLSCLGEEKNIFIDSLNETYMKIPEKRNYVERRILKCSQILKEQNKSSIRHFACTFKEDKVLQYWEELIDG